MWNDAGRLGLPGLLLGGGALLGAPVPLQRRPDAAGHERVRGDAVRGPAAGQLDREQHVGRLGLRVGQPGRVRHGARRTGRRRRPASRRGRSTTPTPRGRRRRRPARSCRPVARAKWPRWLVPNCVSQPCAVTPCGLSMTPALFDQDVQRSPPGRGEGVDAGQVGQVEAGDGDVLAAAGAGDVRGDAVARRGVAHGERHLHAGVGQGARGLDADAGRGAGHDGAPAGQVEAVDHLEGGRPARRRGW